MMPLALPGHPHIHYIDNQLHVEGCRLDALANQYGTPLFVYSRASILHALSAYQRGLKGRNAQICYAMKANPSLAILQIFAQAGCGFDIVSGGELTRALTAGGVASRIVFSGVGKTRKEMREALLAGIGCFNVESEAEIDMLNAVALENGKIAPISIRVNPDVDPQTHPYISTGLKGNKFGIPHQRALATYLHAASLPGLRIIGIDCHIGSQITQVEPYLNTLERVLDLVAAIESAGIPIEHLDFGGGLGIHYKDETPPGADILWHKLLERLDARGFGQRKLLLEPGRSLVGNAGVCITEVLFMKPGEQKNFCIVDAAMNDLPRPALYQAFHSIIPLQQDKQAGTDAAVYDIVGPVCESGDWLGRERQLALQAGDRLAVLSAGAYCMSMSSNYNSRPRCAEILVDGNHAHLIRTRDTISDQMHAEHLL